MSADLIACTADVLTLLTPVTALPERTRDAVTEWLREHDIDPRVLAVGEPIERDSLREMLVWREKAADGLTVRTRLPAVAEGHTWPAPFPPALRSA